MLDYSAIDLTRLPPLDIVEPLDFEIELAAAVADLRQRWPEYSALLESDPAYKLLEVLAYFTLQLRARINEAARACTLANARGNDLTQLAANFNVARRVISPGNPSAFPPEPPVLEPDDELRRRAQLAFEAISTAGPEGAYVFHALGAHADVLDASATSPAPVDVVISVLSRRPDGVPSQAVLDAVASALNAEHVRPLTDRVTVQPAEIVEYTIDAAVVMYPGPDAEVALAEAHRQLDAYIERHRRIGRDVTRSGLYAAIHVPGVQNVVLTSPPADIVITPLQSARCISKTLSLSGVDA
ncbi:MAG: baseplate J/gp47 family protein [Pseudomonadota bacterium]|nr:baseplate J/gp47 family protein [Pseudomonadota bacterium]